MKNVQHFFFYYQHIGAGREEKPRTIRGLDVESGPYVRSGRHVLRGRGRVRKPAGRQGVLGAAVPIERQREMQKAPRLQLTGRHNTRRRCPLTKETPKQINIPTNQLLNDRRCASAGAPRPAAVVSCRSSLSLGPRPSACTRSFRHARSMLESSPLADN